MYPSFGQTLKSRLLHEEIKYFTIFNHMICTYAYGLMGHKVVTSLINILTVIYLLHNDNSNPFEFRKLYYPLKLTCLREIGNGSLLRNFVHAI